MTLLLVIVVLAIMFAISGGVASSRGHNFVLFGFLGLFTSPVVAIIVAFIIPAKNSHKYSRRKMVRQNSRGNIGLKNKNPYTSPQEGYGNSNRVAGRNYKR